MIDMLVHRHELRTKLSVYLGFESTAHVELDVGF